MSHQHAPSISFKQSSSGSNGTPPFLSVFASHQTSLEQDYLWFMEGRVRLEQQFADQLSLLTQRTRALDSGTDALGKDNQRDALPTVRRAWRQILENSEQEVESRRAFANAIKEEVLQPLNQLKNTQQRIASRISDDVKNSRARYAEQASALQKLQKVYFQKTDAYADLTRETTLLSAHSSQPHTPMHQPSPPSTSSHAQAVDQTREKITDLASNSKKGLNQLFANLRGEDRGEGSSTGGGASSGGGVSRKSLDEGRERAEAAHRAEKRREQNEAGAVKAAKAKREAEDADAKYRLGVFHLESLRINMDKVLSSGSNSAAEFVQELIIHLQSAFSKYAISHQATEMFSYQVAKRSEEAVEQVDLARDLQGGLGMLGGGARGLPAPVYYNNYFVGECRDLIFGVSLTDYAYARGINASDPNRIPVIVQKCIEGVQSRGLNAEGLYRISPRASAVQTLIHRIEIDEEAFQFSRAEEIYTVASILKLYLRRLPEPVFRWPLAERVQFCQDREAHIQNDFLYLRQKFKRLPAIHIATLKAVINHLRLVALEDNKMDVMNLSIIFSSVLFGEDEVKDLRLLSLNKDSALEDLILYSGVIFADSSSKDGPPAPAPTVRSQLLLSRSNTVASTRPGPNARVPSLRTSPQGGRSRAASTSSNATDFNPQPVPQPTGTMPDARSVHGLGHRRQMSWKSSQESPSSEDKQRSSPSSTGGPPAGPPIGASTSMAPPPLPRRPVQIIAPNPSTTSIPTSTTSRSTSSSASVKTHPSPTQNPNPSLTTLEVLSKEAESALSQLQGTPPRSSSLPNSPASVNRAQFGEQHHQGEGGQMASSPMSPSQLQQSFAPSEESHAL